MTFAFFGGLRCFFGEPEDANTAGRMVRDTDLSASNPENGHAAALTLR